METGFRFLIRTWQALPELLFLQRMKGENTIIIYKSGKGETLVEAGILEETVSYGSRF
jgi:hypothetical protein